MEINIITFLMTVTGYTENSFADVVVGYGEREDMEKIISLYQVLHLQY